jgi:ribosome-interacting GTPase 1
VQRVLILVSVYVPAIFVLNKIDAISIEELDLLYKASAPRWRTTSLEIRRADLLQIPNSVPISSQQWLNIDELLEVMWDKLNLVRVCVISVSTLLSEISRGFDR